VLVVQSDDFNRSAIGTVIVAAITKNLGLAEAPGNVRLTPRQSGLPVLSVVNISQLYTLPRASLSERVTALPGAKMEGIASGLRLVLALDRTAG
jgi:mRNA interferase MazF